MVIAYILGHFENSKDSIGERSSRGNFEFLHRLVLTDLKPQILYRIKENRPKYDQLNRWVYEQLEPVLAPLGSEFRKRFRNYFRDGKQDINKRILSASHFYATKWEFDIIERTNPTGTKLLKSSEPAGGAGKILRPQRDTATGALSNLRNFIDLCGQLRFQTRWLTSTGCPRHLSSTHAGRCPAVIPFSLEIRLSEKCYNNFFTGLFHDLPRC